MRLKHADLQGSQRRYADSVIEIQVASVLMHAWAEVEHDLIYKPEKGQLSEDETAVLDEINGMVLAGEIALERLQKAIERRTSKNGTNFTNQFELASYLAQHAVTLGVQTSDIGRVDILFEVLRDLQQDTASKLQRYVNQFTDEDKARPIGDVILDRVLAAQTKKYAAKFSSLMAKMSQWSFPAFTLRDDTESAVGFFWTQWISLETALRKYAPQKSRFLQPLRSLIQWTSLPSETRSEIPRLMNIRNQLVHGIEPPNPATLRAAGELIRDSVLPQIKATAAKSRQ